MSKGPVSGFQVLGIAMLLSYKGIFFFLSEWGYIAFCVDLCLGYRSIQIFMINWQCHTDFYNFISTSWDFFQDKLLFSRWTVLSRVSVKLLTITLIKIFSSTVLWAASLCLMDLCLWTLRLFKCLNWRACEMTWSLYFWRNAPLKL